MKNTSGNGTRFQRGPDPNDLRQRIPPRELVGITLRGVETARWSEPQKTAYRRGNVQPEMLLTLVCYCYAAGIYGSEHIAQAAHDDETVRYICAHQHPEAATIRHFRRENRERIEHCLEFILREAETRDAFVPHWVVERPLSDAINPGWAGAHDRVETASFIDMMETDD